VRDARGKLAETHAMEFDLRWVWPAEMELLLIAAGFRRFAVEGRTGLRDGFAAKPAVEARELMAWTAWKE